MSGEAGEIYETSVRKPSFSAEIQIKNIQNKSLGELIDICRMFVDFSSCHFHENYWLLQDQWKAVKWQWFIGYYNGISRY
jgi:hypothetical protein